MLILIWWGMSIVKFLPAPFLMMASTGDGEGWMNHDWSFLGIVSVTSSGASIGVLIFYSFGERFFAYLDSHRKKPRKRFTKINRMIVRIRARYGLKGLLMISGLISVPIASLLAARYYRSNSTMALLVMSFSLWAVFLTSLSYAAKLLF